MSQESLLPSRWGHGPHDDTVRYWAFPTLRESGFTRGNVYEGVPDELGVWPDVFVANALLVPNATFRGFLVLNRWYEVIRPGIEGPKNYNDKFITQWQPIGEGTWYGVPVSSSTGQIGVGGAVYMNYDGAQILMNAQWAVAGEFVGQGERFGAAWVPGNSTPFNSQHETLTAMLRQCPDGL